MRIMRKMTMLRFMVVCVGRVGLGGGGGGGELVGLDGW